ncbi:hypothetical protein JWG45_20495 [Leptospira sp. 201903070]|uniref:ATP-dependent DNA ligase family profile domain-containing protein n=1 Tax=Leptospira ainlahdjerensis TaxID=2810033 RepID=A0ABS2UI38_9LEPT|nr:hypothetical protein [Leptospira ainlahdjerensis]MBM9579529.1 hypothetical protein [Leptospira ainlahdjerensis]
MLSFSKLIQEYREESDSVRRRYLLTSFLCHCPLEELDLVFGFLAGKKEKPILKEERILTLVSEYLNQPLWMIRSAIEEIGDVPEAISLLTGNPSSKSAIRTDVLLENANQIINLHIRDKEILFSIWNTFPVPEKIFFHKLLLGKQNIKIHETLLIEIVADLFDLETGILLNNFFTSKLNFKTTPILRILSSWFPNRKLERLDEVSISKRTDPSLPKNWLSPSSFLKNQISKGTHFLLFPDGISAQAILHSSGLFLWTKNGFLFENEFHSLFREFSRVKENAHILGWLEKNRRGEDIFVYYDILEYQGRDLSLNSIKERRKILDSIFISGLPSIRGMEWGILPEKMDSREFQIRLSKEYQSAYLFYPDQNEFLELKTPEQTVRAVLLYGRKAMSNEGSTFWELSFGVPTHLATHREQDAELLATEDSNLNTIARISLDSKHPLFLEIDSFFKENTIEKKGPIRGVPTTWKAELSFQKILPSKRHKIGFFLENVKIRGKISSEEPLGSLDSLLSLRDIKM